MSALLEQGFTRTYNFKIEKKFSWRNLSKAEPHGILQSRYSKHLTDYKPYSMSNIDKLKKEIKNYKPKS